MFHFLIVHFIHASKDFFLLFIYWELVYQVLSMTTYALRNYIPQRLYSIRIIVGFRDSNSLRNTPVSTICMVSPSLASVVPSWKKVSLRKRVSDFGVQTFFWHFLFLELFQHNRLFKDRSRSCFSRIFLNRLVSPKKCYKPQLAYKAISYNVNL